MSRPSLALTPTHSCPAISVAIISFDICPFLTLVQLVTWHSFLLSGPLCLTFGGFWASCVKLWSYLQGHMRSGATEIQALRTGQEASQFTETLSQGTSSLGSLLSPTPRGTVHSASLLPRHLPRHNSESLLLAPVSSDCPTVLNSTLVVRETGRLERTGNQDDWVIVRRLWTVVVCLGAGLCW